MYDGPLCVQELAQQDGIADLTFVCADGEQQAVINRAGTTWTPLPMAPGKVGSVLGTGGKLPKLTSIGALATSLGRSAGGGGGTGGKYPKLTSIGTLATALGRIANPNANGGKLPKLTSIGALATALGRSSGGKLPKLTSIGTLATALGKTRGTCVCSSGYSGESVLGMITDASGTVVERFDSDDACRPIFLTADGLPSSIGRSLIGLRWMAPECLWDEDVRLSLTPSGAYSPLLGMEVSATKIPAGFVAKKNNGQLAGKK